MISKVSQREKILIRENWMKNFDYEDLVESKTLEIQLNLLYHFCPTTIKLKKISFRPGTIGSLFLFLRVFVFIKKAILGQKFSKKENLLLYSKFLSYSFYIFSRLKALYLKTRVKLTYD